MNSTDQKFLALPNLYFHREDRQKAKINKVSIFLDGTKGSSAKDLNTLPKKTENKHQEGRLVPSAIRKTQIETMRRHHCTLARMEGKQLQ
jgi:hypothetical protein